MDARIAQPGRRPRSLDEARDLFTALGDDDIRHEVDGFRLTPAAGGLSTTETLRRELPRRSARWSSASAQPFYLHVIAYVELRRWPCATGASTRPRRSPTHAFELSRQFDEDASAVHGIQMFTVQRERGRLARVAPLIRLIAGRERADERGVWGPALALLMAELGMLDEARQRAAAAVAPTTSRAMPRGGLWLGGLVYLADDLRARRRRGARGGRSTPSCAGWRAATS